MFGQLKATEESEIATFAEIVSAGVVIRDYSVYFLVLVDLEEPTETR